MLFSLEDGAQCLYCGLFGHKFTSNSRIVNFYSQPYRKWPDATGSFKEHGNAKSGMYSDCKNLYDRFLNLYKVSRGYEEVPVNKMVDSNCKTKVKKAREAISPIVDDIKLCGRQNIVLRGHKGKNNQTTRARRKWSY